VGPPTRPDADVDYTFAQISVRDASVDFSANCGNMSSAIGPFAIEEGLVPSTGDGEAVVRIHNTNTSKIIVSRFRVENGMAVVDGDMSIDGVAGAAAPIRLEFTDPGGAKTGHLLPTGAPRNRLEVPGLGVIEASMVDAANPCIFVSAEDLGKRGDELPDALEADPVFLDKMEAIRQAASVHMGITKDINEAARVPSVPKVAIVASPRPMVTLSGRSLAPSDMSIIVRMISIGQPHRAVPITGALCLAVATRIPGSVPNILAQVSDEPIRIAHPSGITVVDAKVSGAESAEGLHAEYGAVYRTARRLFEGYVLYRQGRA
jgi:2-methylaconitate cis-trans-isomerase PrpF